MRLLCRVPSFSERGKTYAIRMFPEGPGCECAAFEFSPEPKTCKHLAIYEAALHAVTRCHDAGHGTITAGPLEGAAALGLCRQCLVELLAAAAQKVQRQFVPAAKLALAKASASEKIRDIRLKAKQRKRR